MEKEKQLVKTEVDEAKLQTENANKAKVTYELIFQLTKKKI